MHLHFPEKFDHDNISANKDNFYSQEMRKFATSAKTRICDDNGQSPISYIWIPNTATKTSLKSWGFWGGRCLFLSLNLLLLLIIQIEELGIGITMRCSLLYESQRVPKIEFFFFFFSFLGMQKFYC